MTGESRTGSNAAREALERRLAGLSPAKRALMLKAAGFAPVAELTPTIPHADRSIPARLSFGQELLWLVEQSTPGHTYNVPRTVRLKGPIDRNALQSALDALVERHESLRTTFTSASNFPVQVVGPPVHVPIGIHDIRGETDHEQVAEARRCARELSRKPFNLATDLQLRASLLRLADDDHVLHLSSHHIASDGWSGSIVLRELAALYDGFRTGTPVTLPPLPIQYVDFAQWQRGALTEERNGRLFDYWRAQLAGAPTKIDLPTDRPRPEAPGFEGTTLGHTLPADVLSRLRELAQAHGATSFMVYLAVLYVLLARYSGEDELIVGAPVAGRSLPEVEGVVGFFANTLLLRVSLAGNPTFLELLDRVRSASLGAFDHQELPFERLLLARDENNRPLASVPQVVFMTDDPERAPFSLPGTESVPFGSSRGATKFDLTLRAAERSDGVRMVAEFRTDLYDDASIDRLLHHYGTLLDAALSAPDTRVDQLSILDDAERQRVLVEWNDTTAGYPESATIHGLIEQQVRARPDEVALMYPTESGMTTLTYRDLDRRANRVAWTLRDAGVTRDERVGVCLERSLNSIVAILGVLKAGAAYLPIDPAYPDDRIAFTAEDAGTRLMLTDAANRARLGALVPGVKAIDVDDAVRGGASDDAPPVVVSPRDLAYVIYTSGSTGRPKGCMIEHRNVTRLLLNDRSRFDFDEHDVWTIFHSFAFDFSVWEMFGPLIFGARAVVVPRLVAQSASDFLSLLETTRTTVLNQVPSAFQVLMEEAVTRRPDLAVRYVIFGGEALKPALLRRWRAYKPDTRLINMFGITETTVHVTFKEIGDAEIAAGASNIGRPIPTTTVYMLDRHLQPVAVGVPGEICVGGLGVARGYLNRPELNAERFVRDPFAPPGTGALLYRSGDLGRQLPNGEIEYIGRRDHQVKIRGHRIELGEIEAVLLQLQGVAEAVVMVREDIPGDQRLTAYVVPEAGVTLATRELRDGMRERLPEIMTPSAIELLKRLPLTGNGKVDLRALPAPRHSDAPPYQAPRTVVEYEITRIWEKLLNPGRPVGAFDDFFDLGGHSLLAMQMLAEIERARGQRISFAWLLESSTVESLSKRLEEPLRAEGKTPLVALNKDASGAPFAFVHGDFTGVGWYSRRLAKLASPDAPFYVLGTVGSDGDDHPWTIERMAEEQVRELRKVQPSGPYRIGGFCVGGVVAFEMAIQLQAAGETVERLVVIDSSALNASLRPWRFVTGLVARGDETARLQRQAEVMGHIRGMSRSVKELRSKQLPARLRSIAGRTGRRIPFVKQWVPGYQGATASEASAPAGGMSDDDEFVMQVQRRASSAYIPGQFRGVIDLIWASGAPGKAPRANPIDGWRQLADDVRLIAIPSVHIGLVTDNLPAFADALRSVLRRD